MNQTSNPGNPASIKIKGEMWSYLTPRDQGWPVLVRAAQYNYLQEHRTSVEGELPPPLPAPPDHRTQQHHQPAPRGDQPSFPVPA